MVYTVNQLAKLAGVSVRTLHYYDEIGLLAPSYVKDNGYRCYADAELLRLQQILFFRELEFPLSDIVRMMNAPDFDRTEALKDQKRLLELKRTRLDGLLHTIQSTLDKTKGGEKTMNNDDLFASFGDDQLTEYQEEAKKRWGNTDAYKQSMERTKHWTKADYERIKKEGEAFTRELAMAMDKDIKSTEVQMLVQKHYDSIKYFYEAPISMYRNLADMYVNDPRFAKYYDRYKPGLAKWLRDAIHYYCDQYEEKA